MNPEFDRAAAKAAGYSDAEIDAYLASLAPKEPPRAPMGAPVESTRAPVGQTPAQQQSGAERRAAQKDRFWQGILGTAANVSRDIPGAEAVQAAARAGARTLGNRMGLPVEAQSYREALGDIRQATNNLPAAVGVPTRMAGGAVAAAVAPGSTLARQAMAYGAASGLTEANPDVGVGGRVGRAAGQAAAGGALTKALQVGTTATRALRGPTRAAREIAEETRRDAVADPLYDAFRAQAPAQPTQRLAVIMDLPVVRSALRAVKSENNILRNLPDTDPRILDAVYKRVGDKAFTSKFGFDTDQSRRELLGAIDDAMTASGGVPYSPATQAFAEGSANMEASLRGARALQRGTSPSSGSTLNASLEDSPEALMRWSQRASPREREMAVGGMLGEVKQHGLTDMVTPFGIRGGFSLVPGARRVIRAQEMIDDLEPSLTPLQRALRLGVPAGAVPTDNRRPR